jgi:hypothetical protein
MAPLTGSRTRTESWSDFYDSNRKDGGPIQALFETNANALSKRAKDNLNDVMKLTEFISENVYMPLDQDKLNLLILSRDFGNLETWIKVRKFCCIHTPSTLTNFDNLRRRTICSCDSILCDTIKTLEPYNLATRFCVMRTIVNHVIPLAGASLYFNQLSAIIKNLHGGAPLHQ